jgi:hypothetical protein
MAIWLAGIITPVNTCRKRVKMFLAYLLNSDISILNEKENKTGGER